MKANPNLNSSVGRNNESSLKTQIQINQNFIKGRFARLVDVNFAEGFGGYISLRVDAGVAEALHFGEQTHDF